jgi:hypothetical protein
MDAYTLIWFVIASVLALCAVLVVRDMGGQG